MSYSLEPDKPAMNTVDQASFPTTPATGQPRSASRWLASACNSTSLFAISISSVLAVAYLQRDEYLWTPEHGLGYWFGIAGGIFMLLLLLYPLRKKSAKLSFFLGVKSWFKLHMVLGILGPALILLHCNFSFGSINSSIALAAMLLMVFSGLIGRFIYSKVHRGLYGSRLQQQEIYQQKKELLEQIRQSEMIKTHHQRVDEIISLLNKYEAAAIHPASIFGNFVRTAIFSFSTRKAALAIRRRIRRMTKCEYNTKQSTSIELDSVSVETSHLVALANAYMRCVRRTAELGFYEKLFSLWHTLHLPIFGLLIITACFHVYAVHSY